MEAQQCVKLTGTNSSIGLIALIIRARHGRDGSIEIRMTSFFALRFAGLVAIARSLNPIPFRTRPLNSSAPMVLRLKTRESRSLPGLPSTVLSSPMKLKKPPRIMVRGGFLRCPRSRAPQLARFCSQARSIRLRKWAARPRTLSRTSSFCFREGFEVAGSRHLVMRVAKSRVSFAEGFAGNRHEGRDVALRTNRHVERLGAALVGGKKDHVPVVIGRKPADGSSGRR